MAKAKEETNALATADPATMARPDFIPKERTGTEGIGKDDIKLPRIIVAQGLSPQLKESEGSYIDGLRQGHMFNDLTSRIYGKGPIEFQVLRADPPRWIEFFPREEGGGIKKMDIKAGDPETQFIDGQKPAATQFYDFVIRLLSGDDAGTVITLSFKSSGLKVARGLNSLIVFREAAIWAGKYSLAVVTEKNAKGEWYNYSVKNAGWVTEADYAEGQRQHEAIKDKTLDITREPGDDDGGDDAGASSSGEGGGAGIPF